MQFFKNRYHVLILVVCFLAFLLIIKYFQLQVVDGYKYREISENRLIKNVPLKAPRGEILDRYGRPLVTNRFGYTVSIQKTNIDSSQLNDIVFRLTNIITEEGFRYNDTLPVTAAPPFKFTFGDDLSEEDYNKRLEAFIKKFSSLTMQDSAGTVIAKLRDYFGIDANYSAEDARRVIGVRYEMIQRVFSSNNPFTFSSDVNINVVTRIREEQNSFTGVNVYQDPIREYNYPGLASHILGRVGLISDKEYESLKSKGYNMTDTLGKQGVEKAFESYLKGKDGMSSVKRNINGSDTTVVEDIKPVPGDPVTLTIDAKLQQVAEESLERAIKSISNNGRGDYQGKGKDANAGAVVAIDVNSGEVLAIASYPSYDISSFNQLYDQLIKDKNNPIYNRALNGTYSPGSTFKMLTAIAALEENITTPSEIIEDKGIYQFSRDYNPVCWIWNDHRRTHGMVNLTKAIEVSCNYYFYEMGQRLGIDNLKKYGTLFGLGEYTGIELSDEESKGIFVTPDYIRSRGGSWYPGNTLQISIGESFNQFTPLQLANYLSTIVNGGNRYKPHLVKNVRSLKDNKLVYEAQTEIADSIQMSDTNYRSVMDGMRKVTEDGTASSVFASFSIPVGGKTGTATSSSGSANGVFVAFAPFDNPQIAVAAIIEHGAHGNYVAPIAKDIFTEYILGDSVANFDAPKETNVLMQ